jgi:outer membrane lipoprotein-sorting protein
MNDHYGTPVAKGRTRASWMARGQVHGFVQRCLVASGIAIGAAGMGTHAQEKATPPNTTATRGDLPLADHIMDEYAQAMGGIERIEKFESRRSEGTVEMKGAGISGSITLLQAKPNKFLMTMELAGIGKIENGSDGESAWERSVISGNRILEGDERDQLMRRTGMAADAKWREIYESATTVREETLGDRPVWVVDLKPIGSDKIQTNYFDKETKLLLRMKMTVSTPMGDIPVDTQFSNFQDVDGLILPLESRQSILGQSQTMKISKITHDIAIDAGAFSPPSGRSGTK